MKRLAILILILGLWANAPAQTLESYSGYSAAQLSAMTDRVTVPNTAYWNTHAYLQLKLLIDRVLQMYAADSTTAYVTWDKLSAAVQDSILSNLAASSVVWSDLATTVQDSIQHKDRISTNGVLWAMLAAAVQDSVTERLLIAALTDSLDKYRTAYKLDTTAIDTAQYGKFVRDHESNYAYSLADNAVTVAKLDTAAAGWIDVRKFGATGDGVTDDTKSIQDALDYLKSNNTNTGNTTLFFPAGKYVVSSICVPLQTSITGVPYSGAKSGTTWNGGSFIIQKPGSNKNIIVIDSTATDKHWIAISNLTIVGDDTATYGNGIYDSRGTGEGFKISDVNITKCAGSGIKINGTTVPLQIENAHLFENDSSGIYLYMDGDVEGHNLSQLTHISGDNNGLSLIYLRGNTMGTSYGNVLINGVKSETSVGGKQQNVIDIHNFGSGSIDINSVSNSANEDMVSIIRVRNDTSVATFAPHIKWSGITTGAKCDYWIYDTIKKNDGSGSSRDSVRLGTDAGYMNQIYGSASNYPSYNLFGTIDHKRVLPANDDSPFIGDGSYYETANTANTKIWRFDDNFAAFDIGKRLTILCKDNNTEFGEGTYIDMAGRTSGYTVADSGSTYTFRKVASNLWREERPDDDESMRILASDSLSVGGGVYMRNMYQSGNDLGIIFYNSALSRVDTVFAKQP